MMMLIINDPLTSVTELLEESYNRQQQHSGLYLERIWVEDDEILTALVDRAAVKVVEEDGGEPATPASSSNSSTPSWTRLEIVSCQGSRIPQLVETALRQSGIRFLALRRMASRLDECLQSIHASGMRHLQELCLEVILSERSCQSLAAALRRREDSENENDRSHYICLSKLSLESCVFENRKSLQIFAEQGLKYNSTLKSLAMVKCRLRDEDLMLLLPNLPCSLEGLDLVENFCRGEGMAVLTEILGNERGDNSPRLKRLNLTNQHPGELGGGNLNLSLLGQALRSKYTTLIDLDLSFNLLNGNDIRCLIDTLSGHNTTLQTLNLMGNKLDDKAMAYIGKHLPCMTGLRRLRLFANRFGEDGADAVCKGLETNYIILELSMPRGFVVSDRIDFLLALNRGGRRLLDHCRRSLKHKKHGYNQTDQEDDDDVDAGKEIISQRLCVPLGLWSLVLEHLNGQSEMSASMKAAVIFHLVSEGPAVFEAAESRHSTTC